MEFREIKLLSEKIKANVQKVIVGKDEVIDLLMIALIASGHVLLEDVPGMGKTLLAKSLARSLDLEFKRIQFTPDLLPTDISGLNYYNQKSGEFVFRPGPVFPTSFWPMKSTGYPQSNPAFLNAWRRGRLPLTAKPGSWKNLFWSSNPEPG